MFKIIYLTKKKNKYHNCTKEKHIKNIFNNFIYMRTS